MVELTVSLFGYGKSLEDSNTPFSRKSLGSIDGVALRIEHPLFALQDSSKLPRLVGIRSFMVVGFSVLYLEIDSGCSIICVRF